MNQEKILISVQEHSVAKNIEDKLVNSGFSVVVSNPNFSSVTSLALESNPDLIVISVNLDYKRAGIEAVSLIKQKIDVPVIYLAFEDEKEAYSKAKTTNPIAYFSQPIELDNIFRTIELGLNNHKLHIGVIDFQITEEKKLKEYVEELKKSNSAKDKFFSIISHDLRNPFNSLLGFSELLANNIEDLSEEEVKESAKSLHRTATNLFNLLTNLLEWSKLQTGNFSFEKSEFSLGGILNHVVSIYSDSLEAKNLRLIKGTDCEANILADQNMIESAIRKLISNAIKFTQDGGTITVGCIRNGDNAEIFIADTGVGISSDDLERLFKIEKQFTTEGTKNEKGTGFGLLLCKELLEKNNGTIKVKSEKDKGSTFTISLPLKN
jgi:signal transduction histidine kinase